MRNVLGFIVLAALACAQTPAKRVAGATRSETAAKRSSRVQDIRFLSASLNREVTYRVILPTDYSRTERRYPTVVFLHGMFGGYTDWESHTDLVAYTAKLPFIVIMPEGKNSWWVNAAEIPDEKFEDFVSKDLANDVAKRFRTIEARQGRFIAGLSMGGYGALKFALRMPIRYSAIGSFSGAFGMPGDEKLYERFRSFDLDRIYGPLGSSTRQQNDVFTLLEKADAKSFPYMYLAVGAGDTLVLGSNREMSATLAKRGFRYEYHEVPGGHEWPLWDREALNFLVVAERLFVEAKHR